MYVGSGIGKTAWLFGTIAQLDVQVFGFERFVPNHEVSSRTLTEVRRNRKIHNLKVSPL